ncbi:MAG: LCP family protein [Oscillospiraceae bacterium]|jgi:LCP family protein required for cell wall assembly|nr:LCP family protein [Oscillospiraceae bacterium]
MKLFSRKPADVQESTPEADEDIKLYNPDSDDPDYVPTEEEQAEIDSLIASHQRKKLIRRSIIIGAVLLVTVFIVLAIRSIRPPDIIVEFPTPTNNPDDPNDSDVPGIAPASPSDGGSGSEIRKEGVYTFIIAGEDDGTGNTDTILAGTYDDNEKTLKLVSIPRDTFINVPWTIKRASTMVYSGANHYKITKEESLRKHAKDFLGYTPDSYFLISLKAFTKIVDTIGGVYFTVPQDMFYRDPDQNLDINITKGYKLLNGTDAMKVARFRSGYVGADITRIGVQHDLFMAIAKQTFKLENIGKVSAFAKIFSESVVTDLDLSRIIWYADRLMRIDTADIEFLTMPENTNDYINGLNGCSVYVDEWLEMLNTKLSPYNEKITEGHINVIARDANGKAYATNGAMDPNWPGTGGAGGTPKPVVTTPKPAATPEPAAPVSTPESVYLPPPEDLVNAEPPSGEFPGGTGNDDPPAYSPPGDPDTIIVESTPDPGLLYTPPPQAY